RALAALPIAGCYDNFIPFPRASCEGLVAQMMGDKAAAHAAFTTARNEAAELIADQPDYAEALCVLGMADAALGNREEAIREGRRAIELMPLSKNAIAGYLLIEYLALIYAWTGEKDLALQQLAVAASAPGVLSYGELRLHPVCDQSVNLIETLADLLAAHLLKTFPIQKVTVELRKFPLQDAKYVSATVTRTASVG